MNTHNGLTQIKDLLQHNGPKALLQDIAAPDDTINKWLSRLILLGDIPFQNLIGDERLLPQKALRFFYVDQSWLFALIDDALSIGTNTTLEDALTGVMAPGIRATASFHAQQKRAKLLGIETSENDTPGIDKPVAGLLLRSELVDAFPGLKIIPKYADGADPNKRIPLRYEKLADGLMIVIFPEVPVSVKLQQPPQGLRFGFTDKTTATSPHYEINLRYIGDTDTGGQVTKAGKEVVGNITPAQLLREPGTDSYVLNIDALTKAVKASLMAADAFPDAGKEITPSQFAMQIISTPAEAEYINPQI